MLKQFKILLIFALLVACWVIASKYDIDLVNLYAAIGFLKNDPSLVYAQNGSLGRYFYGPFSLVLFSPMSLASYVVVKWIWIVIQTISFFILWKNLHRLYPSINRSFWNWALIFILAINPVHNNFQSNNIQMMLAATLIIAEIFSLSSKPLLTFMAGFLCVACASVKVFPLFLVVYYFLAKSKNTRYGIIYGFIFCNFLPFIFFGNDTALLLYRDFFSNLTTYSRENSLTKVEDILCLPSLVARVFPETISPLISKVLFISISAAFYIYTLSLKLNKKLENERMQIHMTALAWALMVFLNPSSRPHYFLFYLPAFASILELNGRKGLIWSSTILSTLLIAFTAEGVTGKFLNNNLEKWNIPTYGMLILCFLLAYLLSKRTPLSLKSG